MIVLNSSAARRYQKVMAMMVFASMTAACGDTSSAPPNPPAQNDAASAATGEVPQQILAIFRDDLARRASVNPETITVVSSTEQQWPDAAMGCPKPDEMYAQMIVPGYRVVLQASGEKYAYHADQNGNFVVCANGLALPPAKQ
ncbi:MAG: hypothetical protein ABW171_10565 [Steroidobacter sp.]